MDKSKLNLEKTNHFYSSNTRVRQDQCKQNNMIRVSCYVPIKVKSYKFNFNDIKMQQQDDLIS